ncbi:PREDICTED: TNFAIP3-interacting protein 1-like [Amphimedon queenslandica]|uniref:Uncharacterized protein n=1 Tax=Amphimedon queenslandica TaxID=400682 RepID=A0A1X7V531_AMPQE|nr:PREDICTED: TNFAIP3-interacting protein 1-like [Amphimedon queenslandica]|eukprot:XP_019850724.1 PREDICTED: TNFAIP3-interacting protein 1-like [Amphimedon queenslandica]
MADYESITDVTGNMSTEGPTTLCDKNLQEAVEALAEREGEVAKLHQQIKEILLINHKWDEEYNDLKRLYESCIKEQGQSSSASQKKDKTMAEGLERGKEELIEQLEHLKLEKEKIERKYSDLKFKYDHMKSQRNDLLKTQAKALSVAPPPSSARVAQMKEEIDLLKSQVQAFKEDYEAEKRDRERLASEKETERLRYEAEIVSMKIQLDRSTSELVHYKNEAKRLGQQLRLKQQREEEQFRRHLESQGYSARKTLPPLDPFVEKDVYPLYYSQSTPSIPPSSLPSPTSATPPTRRLSLGYQTHMSEVTRPLYEGEPQTRRRSIPFYNHAYQKNPSNTSNNYHTQVPEDHPPRSVSPQIHRVGHLRLYSRESDPNMADVSGGETEAPSLLSPCNDLNTSYEQAVQRRVELDLKSSSLSRGNVNNHGSFLSNGGLGSEENVSVSSDFNAKESASHHSSSI